MHWSTVDQMAGKVSSFLFVISHKVTHLTTRLFLEYSDDVMGRGASIHCDGCVSNSEMFAMTYTH